MKKVEEIIMANFYQDYDLLTSDGSLGKAICLMGISYNNFNDVFEEPRVLVVREKEDFSIEEIQNLLADKYYLLLGIKLALVEDTIRLEGLTRFYEILDRKIRCTLKGTTKK